MGSELRASHDETAMNSYDPPPAESFNGEFRISTGPVECDLSANIEGSIAANQDLLEEVASLREILSEKEQKTEILQQELIENVKNVEAFAADISTLKVENREHASMTASVVQEAEALSAAKVDLLDEQVKIVYENQCLDGAHADLQQKLSLLLSELQEKQAAMEAAQAQIPLTYFEIERLQLDKEEYSKEISMLHTSNGALNSQIVQLMEEEKAHLAELEAIKSAKASAEQRISDLQATISALGVQLSMLTENEKNLLEQLFEAKERLHQLEDADNAMASREADMLAHIKDLESELHALRANLNIRSRSIDQEGTKEGNAKTFDVACLKVAGKESSARTLQLCTEMQEEDTEARCQHVQVLEGRVADLRAETQGLMRSNENLKAILVQQEETEMVVSTQLQEDIKKLEGCLSEAEGRAQSLQGKEVELKHKLQELATSMNKERRLGGLTTPLVISGGTVLVVGLLVFLLHTKAKSK